MQYKIVLCAATVGVLFVAVDAKAQTSTPAALGVSSVSSWPESAVLHRGDKVAVTTFDMSGVAFPCRVKSVSADQLACGKTHDRQLRAFDRASVQSIVLEGHPRHRVGLSIYLASSLLIAGGFACIVAGGSAPCAGLLIAGLFGFLGGSIADRVEEYKGPTDSKTIYVAAPSAPAGQAPAPVPFAEVVQ